MADGRRRVFDRPLALATALMHLVAIAAPADVLSPDDPWVLGRHLLHGELPYRSFPFEYPPGALLAFIIPALLPHGLAKPALAIEEAALEGLVVWFVVRRFDGALRRYGLLSLMLFPFLAGGFDAVPMAAIAFGTMLLASDDARGWWVVAAGAVVKVTPGVAWAWGRTQVRTALLALGLTAVVLVVPALLASHRDNDWLTFSLDRGVEVESVAASVTWIVRGVLGHASTYMYAFKSTEISRAGAASAVCSVAGVAALGIVALRASGRDPWRLSLLSLDAFLVASKVFSPQYMTWTAPLAAIVGGELFVAHAVATALTVAAYSVASTRTQILILAALRNLVIVAALVYGLVTLDSVTPDTVTPDSVTPDSG